MSRCKNSRVSRFNPERTTVNERALNIEDILYMPTWPAAGARIDSARRYRERRATARGWEKEERPMTIHRKCVFHYPLVCKSNELVFGPGVHRLACVSRRHEEIYFHPLLPSSSLSPSLFFFSSFSIDNLVRTHRSHRITFFRYTCACCVN